MNSVRKSVILCGDLCLSEGGRKVFCKKCGNKVKDGMQFCSRCGTPVNKKIRKQYPDEIELADMEKKYQDLLNQKETILEKIKEESGEIRKEIEKLLSQAEQSDGTALKPEENAEILQYCPFCGFHVGNMEFCARCGRNVREV